MAISLWIFIASTWCHVAISHASTILTEDFTNLSTDINTSSGTTQQPGPEFTTCSGEICYNGVDSNRCVVETANCTCDVGNVTLFEGEYCEFVLFNDDILESSPSARTCIFTWPVPPMINEGMYSFVYVAESILDERQISTFGDPNLGTILKQNFSMITEDTARIINLDSGKVNYTVCVMNNSEAERVVDIQDREQIDHGLKNCLSFSTEHSVLWEYTLAAYIIALLMILTVIGLIISKLVLDRIENNKHYLQIKPTESNDSLENNNDNKNKKQQNKKVKPSHKNDDKVSGRDSTIHQNSNGSFVNSQNSLNNSIDHEDRLAENSEMAYDSGSYTVQAGRQPNGHLNKSFEVPIEEPDADYF